MLQDKPKGAIWLSKAAIPNDQLTKYEVLTAIGEVGTYGATNLKVKILSLREKFIAIPNRKKETMACQCAFELVLGERRKKTCRRCSQPDYFLHVWQQFTGQATREVVEGTVTQATTGLGGFQAGPSQAFTGAAGTQPGGVLFDTMGASAQPSGLAVVNDEAPSGLGPETR